MAGDVFNDTGIAGSETFDVYQTRTTNAPVVDKDDIWPWRIGLFGVGGACIACVGVVCNVITIIVLAHYRNKSSAPFLLIFLEMFDTIFLISELFLENLTYIAQGGLIDDSYRTFITPIYCIFYPVPLISRTCGAYMVVVITLERYVVVAWPLTAHRTCSAKKARIAIAVVLMIGLIYHIPLYMAFTCTDKWNNDTQEEKLSFHRTEFGLTQFYNHVHVTWINLCVSFIIPFLILLTFNTLMLVALWRSKMHNLMDNHRRQKREQKLSIMVVCMTAVFFVCELFPAISLILTTGLNRFVECSLACNKFSAVADTMGIVNAAVNFVIYCATGKKFRDTFKHLFLKNPTGQHEGSDATSYTGSRLKKRLSALLNKRKSASKQGIVAGDQDKSENTVELKLRSTLNSGRTDDRSE